MNQTLRIFRHYNSFCLVDLDDNIWEIDFKPPNSFNLCHVQFSGVDEEKFKKSSKQIPDSLASIIRKHIGEKDNYKEIRKVIMTESENGNICPAEWESRLTNALSVWVMGKTAEYQKYLQG